ncbi:MAG: fibronectin type III domain-containing protein, partial [Lacisediminihabitans sp.]
GTDEHGLSITKYTVTSHPGNKTATSSAAGSITVTGLTNGTDYTFTVVATNKDGDSQSSGDSKSVTPYGTPSAPTGLTGSKSGDAPATVTFSWGAPSNTGGGSVTYHYSYDGSAGTTKSTTVSKGSQGAGPHTFSVYAVNDGSNKSGPSTAEKSVTVDSPPPPPREVVLKPGPGHQVGGSCDYSSDCHLYDVTLKNFTTNSHHIEFFCNGPDTSDDFTGDHYVSGRFCGFDGTYVKVDGVTSNTSNFNQ